MDLVGVFFLAKYGTSPIHFFGKISVYCLGLCAACFLATILMKVYSTFSVTGNPLFLGGLIFFVTGTQVLCVGILAEVLMRVYYETGQKKIYSISHRVGFESELS